VLGLETGYRPTRIVAPNQLVGIVDAVRNAILNWTLKLEEDGILGEGLTFGAKERETAAAAHYTTNNFFGPVSNSQIQQGSPNGIITAANGGLDIQALSDLVQELKLSASDLNMKSADEAQARADLAGMESQLSSPRPNQVVMAELIKSLANIIEGCTGSLLASGLIHKLTGTG
jgi:hypothetical protein